MLIARVTIALLLLGSIPVWVRAVDADSRLIALVRLLIAMVCTLLFFGRSLQWRRLSPLSSGEVGLIRWLLPIAGICFGTHWYTYFEAIQRSSASNAIIALSTYGIHVTWLGALLLKKKPRPRDYVGIMLSAIGAFVCSPSPELNPEAFWGFGLGLVSAVFYATLPLIHQRLAHIPLITRSFAQFMFATLLFLPQAPLFSWSLLPMDWLLLGILGVFCTFVAHNLWNGITTQLRPATSGLLYYLTIFVTMSLETLFLGKAQPLSAWLGASLILGGNALALLPPLGGEKKGPMVDSPESP